MNCLKMTNIIRILQLSNSVHRQNKIAHTHTQILTRMHANKRQHIFSAYLFSFISTSKFNINKSRQQTTFTANNKAKTTPSTTTHAYSLSFYFFVRSLIVHSIYVYSPNRSPNHNVFLYSLFDVLVW